MLVNLISTCRGFKIEILYKLAKSQNKFKNNDRNSLKNCAEVKLDVPFKDYH